MLTQSIISSTGGAVEYFAKENYYLQSAGQSPPSMWYGKGAAILGLSSVVQSEDLRAALEGSAEMFGRNLGETIGNVRQRASGIDLTFSAPKSVSLMAYLGGDERLIAAHETAVLSTLEHLETTIKTRVRTNGTVEPRTTGNIVAALFPHDVSRAEDPDLHTHALLVNATQTDDQKWRAISYRDWFLKNSDHTKYWGGVYRSFLAAEVQKLGYEITLTKTEKGDVLFDLSSIPREVIELFSKRSADINRKLDEDGKTRDDTSARDKTRIARDTRATKGPLGREELFAKWEAEAKEFGLDLSKLRDYDRQQARERTNDPQHQGSIVDKATLAAEQGVRFAAKLLSERTATFTERDLRREAIGDTIGRATLTDIDRAIARAARTVAERGYLISRDITVVSYDTGADTVTRGYTTQWGTTLEKRMLAIERDARGKVAPILSDETANTRLNALVEQAASAGLIWNEGHKTTFREFMTGTNGIVGLQGYAGTAKTSAVLKAASAELQSAGFKLTAMAPLRKQATELGKAVGADAITVAKKLADIDRVSRNGSTKKQEEDEESAGSGVTAIGLAAAAPRHIDKSTRPSSGYDIEAHGHNDTHTEHHPEQERGIGKSGFSPLMFVLNAVSFVTIGVDDIKEFFRQAFDPKASNFDKFKEDGTVEYAFKGKDVFASDWRKPDSKEAWLIDESSMIGVRQMTQLLAYAEKNGIRVFLVGDRFQKPSIQAGSAFGQLQDHGMKTSYLTEIVRQQTPEHRASVYAALARDGRTALEYLANGGGSITEITDTAERHKAMVGEYLGRSTDERRGSLIIAPTRDDIRSINQQLRMGLVAEGVLTPIGTDQTILRDAGLNDVERTTASRYRAGDVIQFHRAYKKLGIEKGDYARVQVTDLNNGTLTIVAPDGGERLLTPKAIKGGNLSVYRAETLDIRPGDQIRFTREDKDRNIANGMTARITDIDPVAVTVAIETSDGRQFTLELLNRHDQHFDHNYAVTVDQAQSLSVPRPIADLPSFRSNTVNAASF